MLRRFLSIIFVSGAFLLISVGAFSADPYYQGKTIRIIVGYQAGGGFDLYARTISRFMSKYIPGNPNIIVENMSGAGSLVSANLIYKVAKPDALTIGHFNGGLFLSQVLNKPGIEFDARKFEYIGVPFRADPVFVFTRASGIKSLRDWMESKTPIKLGGTGSGAHTPNNIIRIVEATLGTPTQLVSGYKGIPDIRLACEAGELAGSCWEWSMMKTQWSKALNSGEVAVVLQAVPKPIPGLINVPLAIDLAKSSESKQLIEICIHKNSILARPFVLPPGTPKEQVQILRKAFIATLQDKEFVAEADKAQLEIDPVSGEDLHEMVQSLFDLDPKTVKKIDEMLYPKPN